jgi:hypothetical protein
MSDGLEDIFSAITSMQMTHAVVIDAIRMTLTDEQREEVMERVIQTHSAVENMLDPKDLPAWCEVTIPTATALKGAFDAYRRSQS